MSYNGKAALINDELDEIVGTTTKKDRTSKRKTVSHKTERLEVREIQPLNEPQRQMIHAFTEGLNIAAIGSAGTGKAQPLHAKVLTPDGWVAMGDVTEGMLVCTPSGEVASVTGVFPQGTKSIYRIVFDDGAEAECCDDHLWSCFIPHDGHNSKKASPLVVPTSFIREFLAKKQQAKARGGTFIGNISVPLIKPTPGVETALPLPPYLLGVLLGDGCITTGTPIITSADQHIIDTVASLIDDPDYELGKSTPTSQYDYKIRQKVPANNGPGIGMAANKYATILKEIGLFGKRSHEKFIPQAYLASSVAQRLALLQGLMDTDGTVGKRAGDISLATTSRQLAEDVRELVWSLGGKASITTRAPSFTHQGIKKQGRTCYTVAVRLPKPRDAFTLERKRLLCREQWQEKQARRIIKDVVYVGEQEAQCIMIDHPTHLYITDDYTCTHNTYVASYLALKSLFGKEVSKIVIVRSAVPTRDMGFLPGTLQEKSEVYTIPYKQIFNDLCENGTAWDILLKKGYVEFITTSFIRGITIDNAVVILDESQSMTFHELDSVVTRAGFNTRLIVCGDSKQNDLNNPKKEKSGLEDFLRVIREIPKYFDVVTFTRNDICRSELVRSWIITKEELGM